MLVGGGQEDGSSLVVQCSLKLAWPAVSAPEALDVVAQVSDLWVSYHNTEDGVSSVSLSLPHVVGIDARPWVLEEHSLVISAGLSQRIPSGHPGSLSWLPRAHLNLKHGPLRLFHPLLTLLRRLQASGSAAGKAGGITNGRQR